MRRNARNNLKHGMQYWNNNIWFFLLLLQLIICRIDQSLCAANVQAPGEQESSEALPKDFLTSNSVVAITGAAGFVGSELAMALHRIYNPKKIILIDSMSMEEERRSGSLTQQHQGLLRVEYQRQRLFHILQTLGSKGVFYRVDFRPSIPEYFDRGEVVPLLDHIFTKHSDITHVVHLADDPKSKTMAVPRTKDSVLAGMMEAILEQLRKHGEETGTIPHFTYASSNEVYNSNISGDNNDQKASSSNPPPFDEEKPISAPSSLHGASKLLDEILVQTYYKTENIYAVGLRFFPIYGPWSSQQSLMFRMAESAVTGEGPIQGSSSYDTQSVQDFVYIDDAVDAIMAAMQFRPLGDNPQPIVVNVGTGRGSTLKEVSNLMNKYFPPTYNGTKTDTSSDSASSPKFISYASTKRAELLLGFRARVPLEEGIAKLLAWHYDRAFPYGGRTVADVSDSGGKGISNIASRGIVACSPYDAECLRGIPVFPCASECSHEAQCTPSYYDAVILLTRELTAECPVVLYTVALNENLSFIPSAVAAVSTASESHVQGKNCNIAFVSNKSPLVQSSNERTPQHGFWTLVPVASSIMDDVRFLPMLPKLSPGLFFGLNTERIIYVDPDVVIDDIPGLLNEASMQPYKKGIDGATAMLIGKGKKVIRRRSNESANSSTKLQERVQNGAYRTVRISFIEEMSVTDAQNLDASFLVHTLNSDDSRLFRCDVFGELVQWEVSKDLPSLEFIIELHDMWSRVIARKGGNEPWWIGEKVKTVPEGSSTSTSLNAKHTSPKSRRLTELNLEDTDQSANEMDEAMDRNNVAAENQPIISGGDVKEDGAPDHAGDMKEQNNGEAIHSGVEPDASVAQQQQKKKTALHIPADDFSANGFGDSNAAILVRDGKDKGDSDDMDDDNIQEVDVSNKGNVPAPERDVSAYDTWMGILSSTSIRYFVRIVPSSEAGVVVLED